MTKVLVVVDMQNDFISGSLGSDEARSIVDDVKQEIQEYKEQGYEVVFTADCHKDNYLETQEGKNLPVSHCIYGTDGFLIDSRLNTKESKIFIKETFGSIELCEYLREKNTQSKIDEIEIVGLCTDICVISNALMLKAFLPEVLITVKKDLCKGVTDQSHNNALLAMKMCQINIK